jgi:anaerobic ribonucleoside-triphosphate reductase activating protein
MEGGDLWTVDCLAARILETPEIEGVTLMGGEPFAQARACADLCEVVKEHDLSVMVFTGYTLEELTESSDGAWARLLAAVDLLVDGRYERDRPERRRRWIGSANQKVCFLSDRYAPNDPQFEEPNSVEIRLDGRGGLQVNGWPELAARLASRAQPGGDNR